MEIYNLSFIQFSLFTFPSDFIRDNAIEPTNKHAPRWEVELPRIQDYILSTAYGMLPLLTFKFPTDRDVTQDEIQAFYQQQQMAMVAARGFNVAYELIGNLRKADWYNQVSTMLNVHQQPLEVSC
jgi:hypothetical protein